jgi:hypothetical protein
MLVVRVEGWEGEACFVLAVAVRKVLALGRLGR